MPVTFYAARDESGAPEAIFRIVEDTEGEALTIERMTEDGTWLDDPEVLRELREPGVDRISSSEAEQVKTALMLRAQDVDPDEQEQAESPPLPGPEHEVERGWPA